MYHKMFSFGELDTWVSERGPTEGPDLCLSFSSVVLFSSLQHDYSGSLPGAMPFHRLGTNLVPEGLKFGIHPLGEVLQRCLGCLCNGSCHFHLQAVMRSEEPHPFSLATVGFADAMDGSYLMLGTCQELTSVCPALTCVSSHQLTGGKKNCLEILRYLNIIQTTSTSLSQTSIWFY